MQVLDWEYGQLYWNCLRRQCDQAVALEKVKAKYLDEFEGDCISFSAPRSNFMALRQIPG